MSLGQRKSRWDRDREAEAFGEKQSGKDKREDGKPTTDTSRRKKPGIARPLISGRIEGVVIGLA